MVRKKKLGTAVPIRGEFDGIDDDRFKYLLEHQLEKRKNRCPATVVVAGESTDEWLIEKALEMFFKNKSLYINGKITDRSAFIVGRGGKHCPNTYSTDIIPDEAGWYAFEWARKYGLDTRIPAEFGKKWISILQERPRCYALVFSNDEDFIESFRKEWNNDDTYIVIR